MRSPRPSLSLGLRPRTAAVAAAILAGLAAGGPGLPAARAQTLVFADGRRIPLGEVAIRDGSIVVRAAAGEGGVVERSTPLDQVVRLEAPEPPELARAREALAAGQADRAADLAGAVLAAYEGVRSVPGSWWPAALQAQVEAFGRAGRDLEAAALIQRLEGSGAPPEAVASARVSLAQALLGAGRGDEARQTLEAVLATPGLSSAAAARAWLVRGDVAMAATDFEGALLAYLRVPVFHGDARDQQAAAQLRAARAYRAMGDEARALRTAEEILERHAGTEEARAAAVFRQGG